MMTLQITGKHLDITEALRQYVQERVDRLTNSFDQIQSVHVMLSVEKHIHKAEITLHLKGKELYADSTNGDLYSAIDNLMDKISRQVVRYKEKHIQSARNSASKAQL